MELELTFACPSAIVMTLYRTWKMARTNRNMCNWCTPVCEIKDTLPYNHIKRKRIYQIPTSTILINPYQLKEVSFVDYLGAIVATITTSCCQNSVYCYISGKWKQLPLIISPATSFTTTFIFILVQAVSIFAGEHNFFIFFRDAYLQDSSCTHSKQQGYEA